jgi:hypothetical protein
MKDTTPPQGTLLFSYDRTSDFDFSSPSSLPGTSNWTISPELVDIDGDGDLDMFQDQKFTLNNGTRNRPDFNYRNPISDSYGLPSAGSNANFADVDGDGDLDAFISDGDVATGVYLNQGDRHNPVFGSAVTGAYGLPQVSGYFIHDLADLDADGDLDALFGYGVQVQIYLNEGTPRSPVFGAAVAGTYGLPAMAGRLHLTDMDHDGDLDVLKANGFSTNEGTAKQPLFGAEKILHFAGERLAFASLADLDGDGDLDAFIGFGKKDTKTISTYTNIGTPVPITKFDTASGNYGVGSTISMTVNFSEPVIVTGVPQLRLNTGMAKYTSGSGTDTLHFTYTVQAGDKSSRLDYESAVALILNGGTIQDAAGNHAILTLATPGTAGSLSFKTYEFGYVIVIDTVSPRAISVSSPAADGLYKAGDSIDVQVQFGEAVTVTGSPQLVLETGAVDRAVNYTSGSGTNTLTFRYTVQAGDTSADLDSIALELNAGSIKATSAGADALLTLPGHGHSLADNKALVINTNIGTLVAPVTSPTAPGKYGAGSLITLSVAFSEPVFVTGAPQIKLETGKVDRAANYISGSGTSTLNFSYTVQAGDTSADLDYQSAAALALNGGSIHDAAGNEATFTLATPGALGSLGASSAIVIDGGLSLSLVGYTPELAAGSFFWF